MDSEEERTEDRTLRHALGAGVAGSNWLLRNFKGEVRSKIKLSHFVVFGAVIRMVLVRGASEQPFLRYFNFKVYQIWESLFMSR